MSDIAYEVVRLLHSAVYLVPPLPLLALQRISFSRTLCPDSAQVKEAGEEKIMGAKLSFA